jgi:prepilin-type processing-associated H-X9-DG protein
MNMMHYSTGPQAVPARSGHDGTRTFWVFAPDDLYRGAASRDGSRSDPKLDPAQRGHAFTLMELLVLVAIFGIGALTLSPALARTRLNTRTVTCMNNMKQLAAGWTMYAGDNNDNLAINNVKSADWNGSHSWVSGWLDWSTSRDNTNTLRLVDDRFSSLGSYMAREAKIYRCPTDIYLSAAQRAMGWPNRVRSVAMNAAIGDGDKEIAVFPWLTFVAKKMGDLHTPSPRESWLFTDVHPGSIADAILFSNPGSTNGIGEFIQLPCSDHGGGCGMSYADGRAEIHKWKDSRTVRGVTFTAVTRIPIYSYSSDLAYIAAHTPRTH